MCRNALCTLLKRKLFLWIIIFMAFSEIPCPVASELNLTVKRIPDTKFIEKGSKYSLRCKLHGVKHGTLHYYRWFDNRSKYLTNKNKKHRIHLAKRPYYSTLKFNNVEHSDEGTWRCDATIPDKKVTKSKTVEIKTWELRFKDENRHQKKEIGTDALIKCEVTSKPPATITWRIHGIQLSSIMDSSRYTKTVKGLQIKRIREADGGSYGCSASIDSLDVPILKGFSINVTVHTAPKITTKLRTNKHPILMRDVKIWCAASGGDMTYSWKKVHGKNSVETNLPNTMKNKSTTGRFGVNEKSGTLLITNLQKSDEGTYQCTAKNFIGKDTKVYNLKVRVYPVVLELKSMNVSEHETAEIVCVAKGDPLPIIEFQKSGIVIHPHRNNLGRTIQTTTSDDRVIQILKIKNVTSKDSGVYTCTATNLLGKNHRVMILDIKFPPRFIPIGIVPTTYSHNTNLQPIKCIVEANPLAELSWKRDGKDVVDDNGTTYKIENSVNKTEYRTLSMLTVNVNTNPDKYGGYTCEASTDESEKITRVYLLLAARQPGRIELTSKNYSRNSNSYELKWKKPDNGGMELLGYNVKYRPVEVNFKLNEITKIRGEFIKLPVMKDQTSVKLMNLSPNTTYQIAINAQNTLGKSPDTRIFAKTAPGIKISYLKSNVVVIASVVSSIVIVVILISVGGLLTSGYVGAMKLKKKRKEKSRSTAPDLKTIRDDESEFSGAISSLMTTTTEVSALSAETKKKKKKRKKKHSETSW